MQHHQNDNEMNDGGEDKEYRVKLWNAIKEAAVRFSCFVSSVRDSVYTILVPHMLFSSFFYIYSHSYCRNKTYIHSVAIIMNIKMIRGRCFVSP